MLETEHIGKICFWYMLETEHIDKICFWYMLEIECIGKTYFWYTIEMEGRCTNHSTVDSFFVLTGLIP